MDTDQILRLARSLGLFALARALTRGRLRILCYHGIWIGPAPHYGDCLFISAEKFEQRMGLLASGGYRVLPLASAVDLLATNRIGARDVVITIDDAWKGIEQHMLTALERHRFPATIYVPTRNVGNGEPVLPVLVVYLVTEATRRGQRDKLAQQLPEPSPAGELDLADRLEAWMLGMPEWRDRLAALQHIGAAIGLDVDALLASGVFSLMDPAALRRAFDAGIDMQLHTHNHTMHQMEPGFVEQEIQLNREALAAMLNADPARLQHLCYPSGEHDRGVFSVLRRCGVRTATTTEFGLASSGDHFLALPRILDGELLSEIQFEARLSGFWSIAKGISRLLGAKAHHRVD